MYITPKIEFELKDYITMENLGNAHGHSKIYSPEKFLGWSTSILKSNFVQNTIDWINPFDNIFPMFFDKDSLSRLKTFVDYEYKTDEEIIVDLINSSPKGLICVKIMDLSCMGAGKVSKTIIEQLYILLDLKKKYPQLRLFPVIDPRTEELHDLIRLIEIYEKEIAGFGLYPNIGYTADDIRLFDIWHWANAYKKSVIIHSTDTTPVYFKGSNKELKKLLKPIRDDYFFKSYKTNRQLCANFANPIYAIRMAQRYRNVNVSFAHAGGDNLVNRDIIDSYANILPNVYYDISATVQNAQQFNEFLGTVTAKHKILIGNDHYMDTTWKQEEFTNIAMSYSNNLYSFLRE